MKHIKHDYCPICNGTATAKDITNIATARLCGYHYDKMWAAVSRSPRGTNDPAAAAKHKAA